MIGGVCIHCGKILPYVSDDICEECGNKQASRCIYCQPAATTCWDDLGQNLLQANDEVYLGINADGWLEVDIEIETDYDVDDHLDDYRSVHRKTGIKINYCPMCGRELKE